MFSVVIPLYNKELSVKSTIQSVLNQSFQEFEVVVVNDGSSDESVKKVKEINDKRIRIIDKLNGGVSSARNMGITEAYYDWIALLDADDLWEENHLETVKKAIEKFDSSFVFTTSIRFSDNTLLFQHKREENPSIVKDFLKESRKELIMCSSTIVIHKKCFYNVGFFNEKVSRGEDADMWWRLAEKYTIVKDSDITAVYRMNAENRSDAVRYDVRQSILYYYKLSFISKDNFNRARKLDVLKALLRFLKNRDFKNSYYIILKHHFKIILAFL
ncbi:glycosyltransferase family 2 protein [Myroides odoratimimus]|uniref:glycosyltransferase family 2 protein n=1 Tax=Myroides odoratimimus TaxID=76832 RepID=UPI003D2F8319